MGGYVLNLQKFEELLKEGQFAEALVRRPSEITKWLSGQHNFTLSTLAMLSSFFRQPIITVYYCWITYKKKRTRTRKPPQV